MMGVTAFAAAVLAASIVIPPGGLWGPVPGAGTTVPATAAELPRADGPRSTADMATVNPGATLTTDEFDAVIAASAADASKADGPAAHGAAAHEAAAQGTAPRGAAAAPAAEVHQHVEPAPEVKPRASRKKPIAKKPVAKKPVAKKPIAKRPVAKKPAAVVYTCPMHPEVTSSKPGTCPKCGMALVRK